jgi:LAO/AO transport system kinase
LASLKDNTAGFYISGILKGEIMVLSRAITLVESQKKEHQELAGEIIDGIIGKSGKSFRLAITGVPGVGKSTFIEAFGKHVVAAGHKLAVLAIDPSSTKSKGSILGDKTRMESLSAHPGVYIRPSPSAGVLGGVTRMTYESILLCEAAGFDYIVVETVGVGQSEIEASRITDFFLLLMLAGAGDELQGIKRGIMEMADAVVITKADGANLELAKAARAEYAHALHFLQGPESGWQPRCHISSATEDNGILEVLRLTEEYKNLTTVNGYFEKKRKEQQKTLLMNAVDEQLRLDFYNHPLIRTELENILKHGTLQPFAAASRLLKKFRSLE